MPKLFLTDDTRKSWASKPSDIPNFLDTLFKLLIEMNVTGGKNEENQAILTNMSANAIAIFTPDNYKISATLGAFFRSRKNPDIEITPIDLNHLNKLLNSPQAIAYLNKFEPNIAPRDAHAAYLKSQVIDKFKNEFFSKVKTKYQEPLDELLNAVFKILEFMNTPIDALDLEANSDGKKTSGVDLQWTSMLKALETATNKLIEAKEKPDEKIYKLVQSIERQTMIFQGAFAVANEQYKNRLKLAPIEAENHNLHQEISALLVDKAKLTHQYKDIYYHIIGLPGMPTVDPVYNPDLDLKTLVNSFSEKIDSKTELYQIRTKLDELNSKIKSLESHTVTLEQENTVLKKQQSNELTQLEEGNKSVHLPIPPSKSILEWIKTLFRHIGNLQKEKDQLKADIMILNNILYAKNKKIDEDIGKNKKDFSSNAESHPKEEAVIELKETLLEFDADRFISTLFDTLKEKFAGTNSTGVQDIIEFISNVIVYNDNGLEKLTDIGRNMRQTARELKDRSLSKMQFFGSPGRHEGVQDFYDLLSRPKFSLNAADDRNALMDLLNSENKTFTHSAGIK